MCCMKKAFHTFVFCKMKEKVLQLSTEFNTYVSNLSFCFTCTYQCYNKCHIFTI